MNKYDLDNKQKVSYINEEYNSLINKYKELIKDIDNSIEFKTNEHYEKLTNNKKLSFYNTITRLKKRRESAIKNIISLRKEEKCK